MADNLDQPYRIQRLQALLDHVDFGGNMSALGTALGYDSGAYIRQMLKGDRKILEKFLAKVDAAQGGKYRGWFDRKPAAPLPAAPSDTMGKIASLGPLLTEPQKAQLLSLALQMHSNGGQLLSLILVPSAQASAPIESPPPGG